MPGRKPKFLPSEYTPPAANGPGADGGGGGGGGAEIDDGGGGGGAPDPGIGGAPNKA